MVVHRLGVLSGKIEIIATPGGQFLNSEKIVSTLVVRHKKCVASGSEPVFSDSKKHILVLCLLPPARAKSWLNALGNRVEEDSYVDLPQIHFLLCRRMNHGSSLYSTIYTPAASHTHSNLLELRNSKKLSTQLCMTVLSSNALAPMETQSLPTSRRPGQSARSVARTNYKASSGIRAGAQSPGKTCRRKRT